MHESLLGSHHLLNVNCQTPPSNLEKIWSPHWHQRVFQLALHVYEASHLLNTFHSQSIFLSRLLQEWSCHSPSNCELLSGWNFAYLSDLNLGSYWEWAESVSFQSTPWSLIQKRRSLINDQDLDHSAFQKKIAFSESLRFYFFLNFLYLCYRT